MQQRRLTIMQYVKSTLFAAVVAATGVAVGASTASLTDLSGCRGLCIIFLEHRFTAWQSGLFGAAASAAVLAVALALSSQVRDRATRLMRWLHEDLASASRS
jgi:hypothetical protein